jgi:excisionase family DNA binding protein
MTETTKTWMPLEDAANYLGVDDITVKRFVKERKLRFSRINDSPTGALRFRREWLDQYLESRATGGEQ